MDGFNGADEGSSYFDDLEDEGFSFMRELAKKEAVRIDYSVLSVGVMTLGLIIVVEVLRHKLDHVAAHRPFYKAVLEGVYAELATLGIVEFFLHVLAEYYEEYDKAKKQVFADVHFLLFYTAILNAIGSLILYITTTSIANKLWVETEMLEVNHYVEIREEFERVSHLLEDMDTSENVDDMAAEDAFSLNAQSLKRAWKGLKYRIRYPALQRKYQALLQQIRFHELRVHFLQAYELPLKFRVSDYLMRSSNNVLVKLIHVSSVAWLLLTGVVNLFYYALGIVSYQVADTTIVGITMIYIFFITVGLFVILSWVVSNKMKYVFGVIMHKDDFWNTRHDSELAHQQKSLFWGSEPKLVIASIQFMQFGYAVAMSTVIIFWEEMNDGAIPMVCYLLAIAVCYALFVHVTSHAIPRYTLCTSLGQLVNEKRLHEALAAFLLENAKLKEQAGDETAATQIFVDDGSILSTDVSTGMAGSTGGGSSVSGSVSSVTKKKNMKKMARNTSFGAQLMVDLIKTTDTKSLRDSLPESEKLRLEQRKMNRKKNRVQQFSDGVTAMRQMNGGVRPKAKDDSELVSNSAHSLDHGVELMLKSGPNGQATAKRTRPRRVKAQSAGVAMMAKFGYADEDQTRIPENEEFFGGGAADESITSHTNEEHKDDDDDASVASDSSGYSDMNDVPAVNTKAITATKDAKAKLLVSPCERLHDYFVSRRYVVISNVFGTMFAFFCVGQRVENFLHSEGIANEKFTHFDFAHEYIFWFLMVWLVFFMIMDCLVLYSMPSKKAEATTKERTVYLASGMDFLLSGFCLILLVVAEVARCCNADKRLLAEAYETAETTEDYFNDPAPCSCPMFGTRQYGGLGTIEPYTSLIALRVFRFWLAKRFVTTAVEEASEEAAVAAVGGGYQSTRFVDPLAVFGNSARAEDSAKKSKGHGHAHGGDHGDGDHGHGHGDDNTGTVAQLWESAIAKHPDIVAKHGEFSSELLRVMLGLSAETQGIASRVTPASVPPTVQKGRSFRVKKEFARLPPAAQGVIVAGKLGCSVVKSKPSNSKHQISKVAFAAAESMDQDSLLVCPNARLTRSMRRCDRKLLPMINQWTVVDVAMTRYEMVYFDASDIDEAKLDEAAEGAQQALIATKGGKGLRLCDVALGRKVVGHLHFSDISSVFVERILPCENATSETPDAEVAQTEFWRTASNRDHANGQTRGDEWRSIKQDRLRIHTTHGHDIYFRFYADLEDAEHHVARLHDEDEVSGFLFKNNAFQWAQTMVRCCGPDKLNQELPHYGDDTSDELRDYLEVHEEDQYPKQYLRTATTRRAVRVAI